jgi:hypothetical protein
MFPTRPGMGGQQSTSLNSECRAVRQVRAHDLCRRLLVLQVQQAHRTSWVWALRRSTHAVGKYELLADGFI